MAIENISFDLANLPETVATQLDMSVIQAGVLVSVLLLVVVLLGVLLIFSKINAEINAGLIFVGVSLSVLSFTYAVGWSPIWMIFLVLLFTFWYVIEKGVS